MKRLAVNETENAENIFVGTTVKKRKWGILFAYRPPNSNNLKLFFFFFFKNLHNLQTNFYQNFTDDFNIDVGSKNCNKFN